ncbi:copper chaperone PCu(A)C [Gracilimonas sp.]|uniref:copper chaperone PCu(A)C n=1 Tax=Gracilimonas sp. TaxID=1974203 RepID=UPI002871DFF5|nr:copper chaperone PCu(A)C [Gracilimonas sp.]
MKPFILICSLLLITISCKTDDTANQETINSEEMNEERVRPAGEGGTSAAYFRYANTLSIPDTLLSVESPVAGMAQIHESYETDDGMMGMRPGGQVILMPEESITFQQGGLHIMLMSLQKDLAEGDSVRIELEFSQAGSLVKMLPVQS